MRSFRVVVWTWSDNADKHLRGLVSNYRVTDKYKHETDSDRPAVADFAVNAVHDADTQKIRAEKLCSYLNEVNSKMNIYDTLTNTNME